MNYKIVTPDSTFILFEKISKKEKEQILSTEIKLIEEVNFGIFKAPIYEMPSHDFLFCRTRNSYALLFKERKFLNNLIRGESYNKVNIFFDEKNSVHVVFHMNSSAIDSFLLTKEYKEIEEFKISGLSLVYYGYEFEDGSICVFYQRSETLKSGYWFENLNSFQYIYKNIWQ